mmetsp:Transcript_252/g.613  ORF Transcript_252/g.613 Transcript_252/m.613 type:complete len:233 (+) Transcript_252:2784-3482(+)
MIFVWLLWNASFSSAMAAKNNSSCSRSCFRNRSISRSSPSLEMLLFSQSIPVVPGNPFFLPLLSLLPFSSFLSSSLLLLLSPPFSCCCSCWFFSSSCCCFRFSRSSFSLLSNKVTVVPIRVAAASNSFLFFRWGFGCRWLNRLARALPPFSMQKWTPSPMAFFKNVRSDWNPARLPPTPPPTKIFRADSAVPATPCCSSLRALIPAVRPVLSFDPPTTATVEQSKARQRPGS